MYLSYGENLNEVALKELLIQETEGLPTQDDTDCKKRSLDFLDIILTAKDDEGKGLTNLEIRNEVDTFLFEGKYFSTNTCL